MKIVFFDGYCNLCNGFIDWLVRHDTQGILKIASLQGETARKTLIPAPAPDNLETILYYRDGVVLERSTAVLNILNDIGWKKFYLFRFVPEGLRDLVYRIVAKNRYTIFGKRQTCRLPTPAEKQRFLS